MRDVLRLQNLVVDCIVGLYPTERLRPQPLTVDVALHLDTRRAGTGAGLSGTVDYARLAGELTFLLTSCQFLLIETAAEALCRYVLAPPTEDAPRASIEAVTLKLGKPEALADIGGAGRAGVSAVSEAGGPTIVSVARPSLEVHRTAGEMRYTVEDKPFGQVDVIHETRACGIYRLRIRPGGTIPAHAHHHTDEAEMVLGPGLLLQGRPVAAGTAHRWPRNVSHRYDNPSAIAQTVLCVDRPAFDPADEVETGRQAPLPLVEGTSYYPPGARP